MKSTVIFFGLTLWLGISMPMVSVWGDYYKYIDRDGRIHFTDDYAKVPRDQRHSLRKYEEFEKKPPMEALDESIGQPEAASDLPAQNGVTETDASSVEERMLIKIKSRLEYERQSLSTEHEALMKEKDTLRSESKSSRQEIEAFNKQAADFNANIKDYEKRLADHNQDVSAYNERVKSYNEFLKAKKEKEKKE